jgi:predicted transcriptional regulator
MKPKNGGRRAGAGRPPNKVAKVALTVKIDPEAKAKLDQICKATEMSQARQIEELITSKKIKETGQLAQPIPEGFIEDEQLDDNGDCVIFYRKP